MAIQQTAGDRMGRLITSAATLFIVLGLISVSAPAAAKNPKAQRNPVPEALVSVAEVAGLEDVRWWGDENPPEFEQWMSEGRWDDRKGKRLYFLAISGGGSNGAFGAGFLNGWTAAGTRPEFTVVTGISTGAIIAPFAFLGPKYDDDLKRFYTTFSTDDLIKKRGKMAVLKQDATQDTAPLRAKLAEFIDKDIMEAIAAEYRKGRILHIGTTNLDAERPVIWSIGRIAASGAPNALDLIHDVILGSAAIGLVFPPVMIEVEANGQTYDEMHVDGGTTNQVFVYPLRLDWDMVRARLGLTEDPELYVMRNAKLAPVYEAPGLHAIAIGKRSIASIIRTQGIGDLDRIYLEAKRDGLDFHLTSIPADFDAKSTEEFDTVYMSKLFELGYNFAKSGYDWQMYPPGYAKRRGE